jgi:hypothetical protein
MRFMFKAYFSPIFDIWLPQGGSIVDCSLHYEQNGSGYPVSKK